jgi:Tol biopolymer transport system component
LPRNYSAQVTIGAPGAQAIDYVFTLTVLSGPPTMAFAGDRDGISSLYAMRTDGTGFRRITTDIVSEQPDWSPNGSRLAFVGGPCCSRQIYVMNADGTNRQQVSSGSDNVAPDWSPDGTQIVYSNAGIILVNADGSGTRVLQYSGTLDQLPKWSPNGREIVFTSTRAGAAHVYLMNADGSNVRQLTGEATSQDQSPAWSPDGSKIVFERCMNGAGPVPWVCNSQWDLFVMNADGSSARNLTNTAEADEHNGKFTPDGGSIGFMSNRDGHAQIYLMGADGSNPVNVTHSTSNEEMPDFTP